MKDKEVLKKENHQMNKYIDELKSKADTIL